MIFDFRLPRRCRTAFTMIEMLTVMGIILILMAILLPVVSRVRQQVRVTNTMAEINKLSGAIDQYFSEYKAYPGPIANSAFDTSGTGGTGTASGTGVPTSYTVATGSGNIAPTGGTTARGITMTENLTLALVGGLELPLSGTSTTPLYNPNDIVSSLGPLCINPNPAKQSRHPAFIDATPGQRMPDLGWDPATNPAGTNGLAGIYDSYIPEFMDKFASYRGGGPRPILYLRAMVGNPGADTSGNVASAGTTTQYDITTILPYADPAFGDFYPGPGVNNSTIDTADQYVPVGSTNANSHYLSNAAPYVTVSVGGNVVVLSGVGTGTAAWWNQYFGSAASANGSGAPTLPRGFNGYILVSAGPDGIFGTTDDIIYP